MDSSLIRTLSSVPLVSVLRSLTVVTCIHAWETNPCKNEFVSMKCPHTSHVSRWSVSQFSKCMSLFRHGCSLPATQLTWLPVSHSFLKFPDSVEVPWPNELTICPDNGLQTAITAILSTHLLHEFILSIKCRIVWSYRKSHICLSFNFLKWNIPPIGPFLKKGAQKSDLL